MNKQQQIEEMAKFMHYKTYGKDCENVKCELCWCPSENDAEALYNAGYRKLPEDSVVLSKEEYEILKIKEKEKHWLETCMSVWKNAKIDGSKETAEKFLQLAYDRCLEKSFIKKVEELAKQFGVEIKE